RTTAVGQGQRWGTSQVGPNEVLIEDRKTMGELVPNVVGMGAKDAVYLLESKGLKVRLAGVGRVKSQSISSGSRLVKGQTIGLLLQ
ncbi:MAG: PASTA domain-containing protein, partial [Bacteroides sp.]|nr:PASTA domain-containing protein [Bacteroides sp.]